MIWTSRRFKMDIDKLVGEARNALGKFCINECNAYCCRKGFLILKKSELNLVLGSKKDELIEQGHLCAMKNDEFSFNFKGKCPQLVDNKCLIHKNPGRPKTCDSFPIFIKGKTIRISSRCYGKNVLYPYISQFIKLGYKIEQ